MLVKILFWFVLVAVLIGVGAWLVVRSRNRSRQEKLWGALEGEPALPKWTPDALGVSAVRVHGAEQDRARAPSGGDPDGVSPPRPAPRESASLQPAPPPAPSPLRDAGAPAEAQSTDAPEAPEASGAGRPDEPPGAETGAPTPPPPTPAMNAQPAAPAEWWGDSAETGALLRALVEATGGSTALLRPDPSDGGFIVLGASGALADALHAREGAHRLGDIRLLDDLPRDLSTTVFGGSEAGLLPGLPPEAVGESAVRALAPAPAPRRLLVADVPAETPLDSRAEHLFGLYADLLARVHDLPLTPPPPPEPTDPVTAVMERLKEEMASAREHGRPLALALVALGNGEALAEADPETVAEAEDALRQRLEGAAGTRAVLPMGALAFAAVCETDALGAERWVSAVVSGDAPLRIGMAVYGPRHVSPAVLRQEAAQALHQTYTSEEDIVIVG